MSAYWDSQSAINSLFTLYGLNRVKGYNQMATNKKESVKEIIAKTLNVAKGNAITTQLKETGNSQTLATLKTHRVYLDLGNDQTELRLLDSLPITIERKFGDSYTTRSISIPVIQALLFATNGLFEIINTNLANIDELDRLLVAIQNGYSYTSSYEQSLKRDPFSYATLIGTVNVMVEKKELSEAQITQWQAVKAKMPKIKELGNFIDLAFESPKWTWLASLMTEQGYTKPVVTDEMESLL